MHANLNSQPNPLLSGAVCRRSGRHEEETRAAEAAQAEQAGGNGRGADRKPLKRVWRYQMVDEANNAKSLPMFAVQYEERYNQAETHVTFVRIWFHVFDKEFSNSELARKLMDENFDSWAHGGVSHCQNALRKDSLSKEHRKAMQMAGGRMSNTNLEHHAGTQYLRVTSESVLLKMLPSIAGKTDMTEGMPCVPDLESNLPAGALNDRLEKNRDGLGGTKPLSPEYLFNAKREGVINWGTVNFDSTPGDVAEDTNDLNNYYNPDGSLRIPDSTRRKRGMFWLTDPGILNIFDAPLPRPVQGNVTPGPALLKLFRDVKMPDMDLASPVLLDHFNNTMTGTDQTMEKMIQSMHESIMTYDTADVQDAERICQETLRNYGQKHDGDDVVEVRQVLKDLAFDSNKIYEKVVLPWTHEQRQEHDRLNDILRNEEDAEMQDAELEDEEEHFDRLIRARTEFSDRHLSVMRELAELQLRRMVSGCDLNPFVFFGSDMFYLFCYRKPRLHRGLTRRPFPRATRPCTTA